MPLMPYLVVDVDNWRALPRVCEFFPQFSETPYVHTSKGMHFYFRLDADEGFWRRLPNVIMKDGHELFSLRGSFWHTYVIGPHSRREDGFIYRAPSNLPPPAVVTAEQMEAFLAYYNPPISSQAYERAARLATPHARRFARALDIARYVAAAIDNETSQLARTPEGARNNTLYLASLRLFSFVKGGYADEFEVRQSLIQAARHSGLTNVEIERTMNSAYRVSDARFAQLKIERADQKKEGGYGRGSRR
ncbi:MAG: hypothetical protein D6750_10290 [Bacteroidetes bacterium]|nr:MAG: hypothetical protein D6750_10290 [Bacteroidota bacterium]